MKKFLIALCAAAALLIYGCNPTPAEKPDEPKPEQEEVFKVTSDQKVTFQADGGSFSVKISSSQSWDIAVLNDKAKNWISFSKSSGTKGDDEVKVTVAANTEYDSREATVRVKSGSNTFDIVVSQKCADALTVSASRNDFSAEAGSLTITVKANIDFKYAIGADCADWISEAATKALTTTTLNFAIAENKRQSARSGAITITSSMGTETIRVNQEALVPSLVVSKTQIPIAYTGGEFAVDVTSNLDAQVTINDAWIHETSTKATSTNTFSFSVDPYTGDEARVGTITFSVEGLSETVTVEQQPQTALVISMSEYIADSAGENFTVTVASNQSVITSFSDDWLYQAKTKALTETEITIGVKANSSEEERTGTVTFTSEDGSAKQVLVVKQNGYVKEWSSSVDVVTIGKEGGSFTIPLTVSGYSIKEVIVPDWITQEQTKAGANKTLYFSVGATPFKYNRRSTITITPTSGENLYVDIVQEGDDSKPGVPDDEIWYTMFNDYVISFDQVPDIPFDQNVVSISYGDGMGKIKFAGPVKNIFACAFMGDYNYIFDDAYNIHRIHDVYLPNCVESLGFRSFCSTDLESFMVPDALNSVGYDAFYDTKITKFIGKNTTEDGKGIVSGSTYYYFAPALDDETYTVPRGITTIARGAFSFHRNLKEIVLPEGLKIIGQDAFSNCGLEYVTIPSSLEEMEYRAFSDNNIKLFKGESKFVSPDGLYIVGDAPYGDGKMIKLFANGSDVDSYSIPEGVNYIDSYSFADNSHLKYLTLPSSFKRVLEEAFTGVKALRGIFGPCASPDNRSVVVDGVLQYYVPFGVTNIYVDNSVKQIGSISMQHIDGLESIVINDEVTSIGDYAFSFSNTLSSITLPAALVSLGHDPFYSIPNLKDVWVRSVDPPTMGDIYRQMHAPDVKFHVPAQSVERYKNSVYWQDLADDIVGYEYTDLPGSTSSYYASSDYSADGQVKTLQKATKGNGINVVVMGDGYTDAMIADGTYDTAMSHILNALFIEEPFKSLRDYFNVYQVNVVSKNGLIAKDALTALNTRFAGGTMIEGSHEAVQGYAKKAVQNLDEAVVIVLLNERNISGGTCYMYDGVAGNYSSGLSISYFSDNADINHLNGLVNHEAMGHGFAKLADEYAYESNGTYVPGADTRLKYHEMMGWYKNVDVNSDPATIKWAKFLSDSRYANEGVGIFEGAYTYWKGIYRPSDYSIMRYNEGGFNAPSREAIWCRVQYLTYGDAWTYDYEEFVEYDAINRSAEEASPARSNAPGRYVRMPEQHCPPVLMGAKE